MLPPGASFLICLQLFVRLASFIANQLFFRVLTAPFLGVATQLEVYHISILFFGRESLRVAIQRGSGGNRHKNRHDAAAASQSVVNVAYLALLLGGGATVVFRSLYRAYADEMTRSMPYLSTSLDLYSLAAMIELLAEPCYLLMQTRLRFGTRAVAESSATLICCIVVSLSTILAAHRKYEVGVLPFALGQFCYGIILLTVYGYAGYLIARESGFSLLPRNLPKQNSAHLLWSYFHKPTVILAGSVMVQSIVKHLLTQGDTILISIFSAHEDQGTYALANNYGGLLARLLFQPIEESSRNYFSKLLSQQDGSKHENTSGHPRDVKSISEVKDSLSNLLRLYMLLSALIVTVGPYSAPSLLLVVAGERWLRYGAGSVLSTYCFYIPFLALNGLTEAFVASVANEAQIFQQSVWMGFFSVIFTASAFLFMRILSLGAQGLVLANITNMSCRVIWSIIFIKKFFAQNGVEYKFSTSFPGTSAFLSFTMLALIYKSDISDTAASNPIETLARLAGVTAPILLIMYVTQKLF